ncbi:metallophosphoesterase [Draconibacterium sp.]|nr:metallophosphoesterase [Draconibacterium sp.]
MPLPKSLNKSVISLAILFIIAGTTYSQNKNQIDPWFFIQLTDPQFGMFENNAGFKKETILYEKAVAGINRLQPDFVVITGDFVHDQNSNTQINEFKRITAKINPEIPVYYVPGNHDIGQTPDKESLQKYKKNYGRDRFSFSHKGSNIIGFNTSFIKAGQKKPEQKQFKWLNKKLKNQGEVAHTILFCHYPLFNKTIDEPETYSNLGIEYRETYLSFFEKHSVDAVFTGHYHNNALNSYGDIKLVTTSSAGKPLGDAPSGMRIIKIYTDKIEHEYYGFDELPHSITFGTTF